MGEQCEASKNLFDQDRSPRALHYTKYSLIPCLLADDLHKAFFQREALGCQLIEGVVRPYAASGPVGEWSASWAVGEKNTAVFPASYISPNWAKSSRSWGVGWPTRSVS
jgi:hypothetical protein